MELQWPLILFTTFISASAGLFAALDAMRSQSAAKCSGVLALASSELSALTTICYAIAMSTCENTFFSVKYRYDPTHPTHALVDAAIYLFGILRRVAVVDSSRNRTRPRSIRLRILGQEVREMEHCGLAHRSMLVRKRHPASHGLLHHRRQRLRLLASIQARKANLQRCVPPTVTSQKEGTHPKPQQSEAPALGRVPPTASAIDLTPVRTLSRSTLPDHPQSPIVRWPFAAPPAPHPLANTQEVRQKAISKHQCFKLPYFRYGN